MTDTDWPPSPGEKRHPLSTPLRASIRCRTCGNEIEAYASVSIHGMSAGHAWRHVVDGSTRCVPQPRRVEPYDHWHADAELLLHNQKGNA